MCKVGLAWRPEFNQQKKQILNAVDIIEIMPEHFLEEGQEYDGFGHKEVIAHTAKFCLGNFKLQPEKLHRYSEFLKDQGITEVSDHLAINQIKDLEIDNFIPINPNHPNQVLKNLEQYNKTFGRFTVENPALPFYIESDYKDEVRLLNQLNANVLLDINNLYINSVNFDFDPLDYLERLTPQKVVGFHVAGHDITQGDFLVDSHMSAVSDPVFDLLKVAYQRFQPRYIILENDNNSRSVNELLEEVQTIKQLINS